jgi:hypothetical protein
MPDGCGDVDQRLVRYDHVAVEWRNDRGPWHDIDKVEFTAAGGDLDIQMRLCGDVPAPGAVGSGWWVSADIGGDCYVQIGLVEQGSTDPARTGRLIKDCVTSGTTPLGGPSTTVTEVYGADLPSTAFSVTGKTIAWHLTPSLLRPIQAKSLTDPHADAVDSGEVTEVSVEAALVSARGPGSEDHAAAEGVIALG